MEVVVDSYDKIELATTVTATGNLVGVTSVQVNGHSLGGHLASSFARIFGGENLTYHQTLAQLQDSAAFQALAGKATVIAYHGEQYNYQGRWWVERS